MYHALLVVAVVVLRRPLLVALFLLLGRFYKNLFAALVGTLLLVGMYDLGTALLPVTGK